MLLRWRPQVVGFFVIEAWVGRLLPDLVHQSTAQLLWEGAAAQLKVSRTAAAACARPHRQRTAMTGLLELGHVQVRVRWRGSPQGVLERVLCSPGAPGLLAAPAPAGGKPGGGGGAQGAGVASIMVTVKDFVMLAADALEEVGCSPAALEVRSFVTVALAGRLTSHLPWQQPLRPVCLHRLTHTLA